MAATVRMMGSVGCPSSSSTSWMSKRSGRRGRGSVLCATGSLTDEYRTLRIQPGASESDVKKAFRQLALQYHPDVCKGRDCGVQFHRINEAYDIVISALRTATKEEEEEWASMQDDGELWEEWMGWEGAGIRDYSSHINPYI